MKRDRWAMALRVGAARAIERRLATVSAPGRPFVWLAVAVRAARDRRRRRAGG